MDLTIRIHLDRFMYGEEIHRTRAYINSLLNKLADRTIPFDEDDGYFHDSRGEVLGNWSLIKIER